MEWGEFPKDGIWHPVLAAANHIRIHSPRIIGTPRALRIALGVVPVAAIAIAVRVLAIVWDRDREWISNLEVARAVMGSFGLDQWFNLTLSTVFAQPGGAALLIAFVGYLMVTSTSESVIFGNDGVSWHVILTGAVAAGCALFAVLMADWWIKPLIILIVIVILYIQRVANPLTHLRRWRHKGANARRHRLPGPNHAGRR